VIAVLLEGPGYGYEIASRLKKRLGPSWRIYAKHLYPVLRGLEEAGLVRSEETPGDPKARRRASKNDRTVYSPTPAALEARDEWMAAPIATTLVRADIQAHLAFAREEEAPTILKLLDEYEERLLADVEANTIMDTPRVSWLGLVMSHGRASVTRRLDAEVAWIGDLREDIERFLAQSQ
jgi:DNA-binding PadR family transcriptional regulator